MMFKSGPGLQCVRWDRMVCLLVALSEHLLTPALLWLSSGKTSKSKEYTLQYRVLWHVENVILMPALEVLRISNDVVVLLLCVICCTTLQSIHIFSTNRLIYFALNLVFFFAITASFLLILE